MSNPQFSESQVSASPASDSHASTLLESDLVRGLRGLCPCCGKGRLFRAYLKVSDDCPECGDRKSVV